MMRDDTDDTDDNESSIQKYGKLLHDAISTNGGRLDLAILGIGGAYPVYQEDGSVDISGGHLAFNEPGSDVSQSANLVHLTKRHVKIRHIGSNPWQTLFEWGNWIHHYLQRFQLMP